MKAGWTTATLSEVCEFQRGLTYAKSDEVDTSRNVVLRANNIDLVTNRLDFTDLRFISDAVVIPAIKRVRRDSLLVCTASGSKAHLGKVAFIDTDYDFAFGGFMGQLTPGEQVLPKFLFYMMISEAYKDFIASLSDGANINNLKFTDLGRFRIPIPPLPEQRRIVALLDEAFAGLATAAANAERNLDNARELFESHLSDVFARRGEGWVERQLAELAENMDSRRVPITKGQRKAGPYPYYGASGVVDHVADYIFDGDALLISEDGANLLARSTPIAFSVSGRYWVNNHAHVLCFDDLDTQRYVEYYFESISVAEFVRGAAQPKLTQKALNAILVPLPSSVGERKAIVAELDSVSAESQRLSRLYEQRQAAFADLKRSLLHHAFSGSV